MSVTSTLHINLRGNAKEALEFYASVFGGEVVAVPYGDADLGQGPGQAGQIVWGQVAAPSGFHVMVYDIQDSLPWNPGENPYYLALQGSDAEEITGYWKALSESAEIEVPLGPALFSPVYGKLKDRFGVVWVISVGGDQGAS